MLAFILLATPCFPIAPYLNKEIYPNNPSLKPILNPLIGGSVVCAAVLPCISILWIILLVAFMSRKSNYIPEANVNPEKPKLNLTHYNPLITIWFRPRATMRQIVATKPEQGGTFLVLIAGIYTVLSSIYGKDLNIGVLMQFVLSIGIGSALGLLALRVFGKLLHWWSRRVGGSANPDEVRAAIAWSTVPDLILLTALIIAIILNNTLVNFDMI